MLQVMLKGLRKFQTEFHTVSLAMIFFLTPALTALTFRSARSFERVKKSKNTKLANVSLKRRHGCDAKEEEKWF